MGRTERKGEAMEVLHLTSWKEPCGVADYTANMVGHLDGLGVRGQVFPLSTREMKLMSPGEVKDFFKRFRLRAEGFDLVHIQHEFSFFAGPDGMMRSILNFGRLMRSLKRGGTPVVVTFHTEPEFAARRRMAKARLYSAVLKLLWRLTVSPFFKGRNARCRAVVHTRKSRLALIRSGFALDNIRIVPMGYVERDASLLDASRREAREKLGLPDDCILLSMFGFVSSYKGYEWAVRVLKKLPPRYHLAIIGGTHPEAGADYTINSILRAWQNEDQSRLTITGYVPRDTIDLYHAATDICLALYLPHVNLSASAGITWALTSGKPTIASQIPAFTQINQKADCMLMVTPSAVHELTWQIEKLASDRELQQTLVRNALRYSVENSWAEVTKQLITVYQEMVGEDAAIDARAPEAPRNLRRVG